MAVIQQTSLLNAFDVNRGWALFALFDVKGDLVTFAQIFEDHVDQRTAVKKQIFFLTFNANKTKTTIGKLLDDTCRHSMYMFKVYE